MSNPPPQQGRNWSAIAALLGGAAALITAVVGVLTFVFTQIGHGPAGPTATPKAPGRTPAQTAPTTPTTPTTEQAAWRMVWQGPFLFDNNGVNFDHEPPLRDGGGLQVYSGGDSAVAAARIGIAALPSGAATTPAACADRIVRYSTGSVRLDKGTRVCVRTDLGRIALMVFEGNVPNTLDWEVNATIWQPTS